jgi:hypothetical protein
MLEGIMDTTQTSYVLVLAICRVCDETVVLCANSVAETLKPEWKERLNHAMHPECQDAGDDPCAICPVQGCDGSHCKADPCLPTELADEAMLFKSQ